MDITRKCHDSLTRFSTCLAKLVDVLGAVFILRKDIGVGGWSIKWQFPLTLWGGRLLMDIKGEFSRTFCPQEVLFLG